MQHTGNSFLTLGSTCGQKWKSSLRTAVAILLGLSHSLQVSASGAVLTTVKNENLWRGLFIGSTHDVAAGTLHLSIFVQISSPIRNSHVRSRTTADRGGEFGMQRKHCHFGTKAWLRWAVGSTNIATVQAAHSAATRRRKMQKRGHRMPDDNHLLCMLDARPTICRLSC